MKIALAPMILAFAPFLIGATPASISTSSPLTNEAVDQMASEIGRVANAAETLAEKGKTPDEKASDAAALAAQKNSAKWAFWAVVISAIQGAIGIIGLLWVKHTLEATRTALTTASTANTIAQDGVAAAKQATEAQLRAWLSLDVELHNCSKTAKYNHFTVGIAVKNIGSTPALDIKCKTVIRLETQIRMHPPKPANFTDSGHILHPLMPSECAKQTYGERITVEDVEAAYAKTKPRDTPIAVLDVMLSYRTTFDVDGSEPHITSARFLISPQWKDEGDHRDWLRNPALTGGHAKISREDYGPALMT